jgi:hypothetical protein
VVAAKSRDLHFQTKQHVRLEELQILRLRTRPTRKKRGPGKASGRVAQDDSSCERNPANPYSLTPNP